MQRDRRLFFLAFITVVFLLAATSLYFGQDYLTGINFPKLRIPSQIIIHEEATDSGTSSWLHAPLSSVLPPSPASTPQPIAQIPQPSIRNGIASVSYLPENFTTNHSSGTILSATRIQEEISAILDPNATKPERLECPRLNETRYAPLNSPSDADSVPLDQIDYFFALDLRNCLPILPRLIGSIIRAIAFLGPHRCALSIIEGNSPDGTGDVLGALRPFLDDLDITYYYNSSDINPQKGDRISKLAQLRNLALQPLLDKLRHRTAPSTTVLFINDVSLCPEDILEIILQRRLLGADMTCAMDWTFVGPDPTFYDVWVARGISGDSFFEIPPDGSWDAAWDLFWNDARSQARLREALPFQVYSCWNGAVAFAAAPLLEGLRFRRSDKGHCQQGEPQNFCKDLWGRGYGKIAVVPSVNLEYSDERARQIKQLKGYVSDNVRRETLQGSAIDWAGPPDKVKCIEGWGNQFWKPWKLSRREWEQRRVNDRAAA